jgi:hypothetical protein
MIGFHCDRNGGFGNKSKEKKPLLFGEKTYKSRGLKGL